MIRLSGPNLVLAQVISLITKIMEMGRKCVCEMGVMVASE